MKITNKINGKCIGKQEARYPNVVERIVTSQGHKNCGFTERVGL